MTTDKKAQLELIEGEREALEDELMNKLLSLDYDNEDVDGLIDRLTPKRNHLSMVKKQTIH